MKGLLIAAMTAALVVGGVYVLNAKDEPGGVAPGEVAGSVPSAPDAGGSLRDQLLHSTAQELGITPVRGVWGVLMERGYTKGVATIIALADGTASMYLSTGGSAVGGKAYSPARVAALKLCEQAADSLGETVTTHDFPPPAKGRVRFYVLASDGVHVAEGGILAHAKDGGRDVLAPLLAAGDAVIEELKDATSKGLIR
jgi:hypothetical protein